MMNQAGHDENRFYTVKDIMKFMSIGKNRVYQYIQGVYEKQSPFPVIKISSTYRIPKAKYDEFTESGQDVNSKT